MTKTKQREQKETMEVSRGNISLVFPSRCCMSLAATIREGSGVKRIIT